MILKTPHLFIGLIWSSLSFPGMLSFIGLLLRFSVG